MSYLERNYLILEERMKEQTEISLNFGKSLLDSELDLGILNVVVKPVVKSFYQYWGKDARKGTLEQIKVTLNTAKALIEDGNYSEEKFNQLIDKNFIIYLQNDQTDRQCKRDHKNYRNLKEITKNCFITQVQESILLLNVKEDNVKTYDELSRAAFKTKEKAFNALKRQLDFNEAGIEIVEKDPSILKVLTGKNIILKVLRRGFELTKENLLEELDTIFN
ncbi:MAG: hypothetical protein ACFFEO_07475 [Candidatus Thorarchaeota archaeon]